MKKQILFIFIIILFSINAIAQTKELSVGTGVLFNGHTSNIMYRKYKPDFKSALRIQITAFDLSMESSNPFQSNIYNANAIADNLKKNESFSYGLGLYIGKEKEMSTNDKFRFYKGFDVGFTFSNYNSKRTENIYYSYLNDTVRIYNAVRNESKGNDMRLYYNPFIGVQYKLMPDLFIFLEPRLNLTLTRNSEQYKSNRYRISDQTIEDAKYAEKYEPTVSYGLHLKPSAILLISYRFKEK